MNRFRIMKIILKSTSNNCRIMFENVKFEYFLIFLPHQKGNRPSNLRPIRHGLASFPKTPDSSRCKKSHANHYFLTNCIFHIPRKANNSKQFIYRILCSAIFIKGMASYFSRKKPCKPLNRKNAFMTVGSNKTEWRTRLNCQSKMPLPISLLTRLRELIQVKIQTKTLNVAIHLLSSFFLYIIPIFSHCKHTQ